MICWRPQYLMTANRNQSFKLLNSQPKQICWKMYDQKPKQSNLKHPLWTKRTFARPKQLSHLTIAHFINESFFYSSLVTVVWPPAYGQLCSIAGAFIGRSKRLQVRNCFYRTSISWFYVTFDSVHYKLQTPKTTSVSKYRERKRRKTEPVES